MSVKRRWLVAVRRKESNMPITASQWEKGTLVEDSKCRDLVLDILIKTSPKAYQSSDLIKEVKKSESMVRHTLKKLFKERKIEKKKIEVTKGHMVPFYRAVQLKKNAKPTPARKKRI